MMNKLQRICLSDNVKVSGDSACVVHGHAMKPGSKTDKPKGTKIKCYPFSTYGKATAIKKAYAMHTAIVKNEIGMTRLKNLLGA